jgi:hypothetical protein
VPLAEIQEGDRRGLDRVADSSHLQTCGVDVNTRRSSRCLGGYTLGSAAPRFGGLDVDVPACPPDSTTLLVPLKQLANHIGEQAALGAFGLSVHGVGSVVVGQDRAEVVCG